MTPRHRPGRAGTLLVLGADMLRASAFACWARMGLRIVLADGYSPGRYEDLADEFWPVDVRDETARLDEIRALAARCDGIVTLSDRSQRTAALVADERGLPGSGVAAAEASRCKTRQRALAQGQGLPVPRWSAVRSADDLHAYFADSADGHRPSVFKPADSGGSTAVHQVSTLADAAAKWPEIRRFSPSGAGIVEEMIDGPEVSAEASVADGAVSVLSVTRKETGGPTGFIEISHEVARDQPDARDSGAAAAVQHVARLLQVRTGIMHAEFKLSDGGWVLIEAAIRPAGGLIADITDRARGINLYECLARLALGEKPRQAPTDRGAPRYARVRFLVGEGPVRRLVAPAEVLRHFHDIKVVHQLARPGQRLRASAGNWGRGGYALGWGDGRERLDTELRGAVGLLARQGSA